MSEEGLNNDSLKNKKVLITGASKGLGQVCAEVFACEGAKLILAARSKERLEKIQASLENPSDHIVFAGDLNCIDEIKKLNDIIINFGDVDVILHGMGGGLGLADPLLNCEEFDTLFKTNIASAVEINRMILPRMIERKEGNVVHVGALAGTEAVGSVGYSTVKAAQAAYVRSLGRQLADTGVIITGIMPGGFIAPDNSWVRLRQKAPETVDQIIAENQPRGRLGDAQELITLILFLASRRATMMTGCCVPIDGGQGVAFTV